MPSIPEFADHTPDVVVASIGGSMVRPNRINQPFVEELTTFSGNLLDMGITPVYTIGGGGQARIATEDLELMGVKGIALDYAGIAVVKLNNIMLEAIMQHRSIPVQLHPSLEFNEPDRGFVHLVIGTTPGQTSDAVAVNAAIESKQHYVFNVSDIEGVYPKTGEGTLNTEKVIPSLTWDTFRTMIPPKHEPGIHVPFDPVASEIAQSKRIVTVIIGKTDIFNKLTLCLSGKEFAGTIIHP